MASPEKLNVAIIGAGIIGVMSAWRLAKQGHQVTIYERWNTPNDRGASAGESRIFRTAYKEGSAYVPLLKKSQQLWDELQSARSLKILQMCGGLTIGHPQHPDVRAVVDCAESKELEYRPLNVDEMCEEYPQFQVDQDEVGVFDPAAGIIRPELAVLAARDESIRLGATYRPYTHALNIRPMTESIIIDAAQDSRAFDKVVVTTGPWASELSGLDKSWLRPRRLVAGWFPAHDVTLHEPSRMPIAIRRHAAAGFSCFPILDGSAVKILPHHLPWADLDTPEDLPRFVEPEFVQGMERAVGDLMPRLDPTAVRVSTWSEAFTPDGAPLVGPSPEDDRIFLAVGMSGQGFKFSPMVGSIINDLVTNGTSADAIRHMDTHRFSGA